MLRNEPGFTLALNSRFEAQLHIQSSKGRGTENPFWVRLQRPKGITTAKRLETNRSFLLLDLEGVAIDEWRASNRYWPDDLMQDAELGIFHDFQFYAKLASAEGIIQRGGR